MAQMVIPIVVTGVLHAGRCGSALFQRETSQPGMFAPGDVRSESAKRVATAVGEGGTGYPPGLRPDAVRVTAVRRGRYGETTRWFSTRATPGAAAAAAVAALASVSEWTCPYNSAV
jgi:hypothetical protein